LSACDCVDAESSTDGRANRAGDLAYAAGVVPELAALGHDGHRAVIVASYRVVSRVEGRSIWIEGVFDAPRALEETLARSFPRRHPLTPPSAGTNSALHARRGSTFTHSTRHIS
jgi:hypothetical protein